MTALPPPSADDGARTEASVTETQRLAAAAVLSAFNYVGAARRTAQGGNDDCVAIAFARLAAPATPAARGEDWVLVPRVLTDEMAKAGAKGRQNSAISSFRDGWKFALAAAPVAPTLPPVGDAESLGLQIAERIRQEMTSGRQWWLEALSPAQREEYEADLTSTCVAVCEQELATLAQPCAAEAMREALKASLAKRSMKASLAKRSMPTMDPPWSAAFNAALDMVERDVFGPAITPPVQPEPRDPCENVYADAKTLTDRPVGAKTITEPRDRGAMGDNAAGIAAVRKGLALAYTLSCDVPITSAARRELDDAFTALESLATPGLPAAEQEGGR